MSGAAKTKQLAAAVLIVGCAGAGNAQTQNVTIYGVLDTGVEYLTHVNSAGSSLNRMPNLTGLVPSRLGFKGTEDLGGDLSAVFTLESGVFVDSGALGQGGRMWGRQAYVGLSSRRWGTLTVGRLYTMTANSLASDTMGPALYSMSSLDPYLANARADNAIGYLGRFGALSIGATYSLGRDAAGVPGVPNPGATLCPGEETSDKRACREWSAMLKYETPAWGAAVSYDVLAGGPGETLGLESSGHRDKRAVVAGWATFGQAHVSAGVLNRRRSVATETTSNLWFVGGSYQATPHLTVAAELHRLDVNGSPDDTDLVVVRGVYDFSKRTAVYAMVGHAKNSGRAARSVSAGATVGEGMGQTGLMVGVRHSF